MSEDELTRNILEDLDVHRVDPMNDVLFKFIFGKIERKDITVDFLNSVLEPSLGHKVVDLRFISTELIPQSEEEKLSRLDVACELDTGELVDVEVQVVNYNNMQRRTMYYWAGLYLSRLAKGQNYRCLRPVITINILAFKLLPQEEPHAMYGAYNPKTGDRLTGDFEIHFLEIPKFTNKPVKDMTKMERWMAYFSGKMDAKGKEALAMNEEAIGSAYDATLAFFQTPEERLKYLNRQMAIMDYQSGMESAEKRGEERGEKRGTRRGEDRTAQLFAELHAAGRDEEAFRAMSDASLREKLFQELRL
ncbi:Rpn family recombination-promoting nuclease/putative transposase [uncultured Selenomonas sp.]|uniref:Rpn family recombination-promoting nuclease/putative transposase n=1 Tax=uncultured Selenomonas sp. TaxID=159275 RepID=UPI0025FD9055|nr:Rpn family recombination-promoting nuclease/putative transposase [uncultured Selenomonas sp.]